MRKRLQILVGALLGIGLIWLFLRDLDGRAALETIRGANWSLLGAATLLTMSTYLIRAVRWRALLEPVSPGVRLSNLFNATTLGFLAVFLVGRTGEIVRPVALSSKEHVRPSASLATILISPRHSRSCMTGANFWSSVPGAYCSGLCARSPTC